MKIRTPQDKPLTAWARLSKWIAFSLGTLIVLVAPVFAWLGSMVFLMSAANDLGYVAPFTAFASWLSAVGVIGGSFWISKKLYRILDENIVGRTRTSYIRSTESPSSTRLSAISDADHIVDGLMASINAIRKGSTVESRTNDVIRVGEGWMVTTYITVLVSGYELSDERLKRDDSPEKCAFEGQCSILTRNRSGICDSHSQQSFRN